VSEDIRFACAFTIPGFCAAYGIGRTLVYEEIKAGRLSARKVGNRTLILRTDAEAWAAGLPSLGVKRLAEPAELAMSMAKSILGDEMELVPLGTPRLPSLMVDRASPEALAEPRFVDVREVPRSGVAGLAGPNDGEVRHDR
jgi:hypothetical protein